MTIDAVVFDLDDTVVVDEAVSREALEVVADEAARWHGLPVRDILDAHARHRAAAWAAAPCRAYCERIGISFEEALYGNLDGPGHEGFDAFRAWSEQVREEHFDRVLRSAGAAEPSEGERLAASFRSVRRRLQRLMPDAVETLERLRSRYRIGLLTNGAGPVQWEKIHDLGLAGRFDEVLVSGEFGKGKPDAAPFVEICKRLAVEPGAAAMVGNSLTRDILGARAARFGAAVWLRVPGSEEPADVTPDAAVDGLHELPGVLARLAER